MRERDVEQYLVKRVKAIGGEVRKVQWVGRNSAPDRLLMLPPCWCGEGGCSRPSGTIWVELKAPGVKPRAGQLREHARMRKMGQRVEVIDSLESVEDLLS